MSDTTRRVLRLAGAVALTLLVYWANIVTPPAIRLGILFLVPILLVTWYEGLLWGVVFAAACVVLREVVAADQMPRDMPTLWRVVNTLTFVVVVAIAMAGIRHMRDVQVQLVTLATRDPLTNVLNARAFSSELAQELERNRRYGRPMALLYLDLDDFKAVNDQHGHQTGDAVLRLVAEAVRAAVRQADIVGRMGGDEFAVLMPETDGALADAAAARLAGGIRTVFRGSPSVTASIGVVACVGTETSPDELLRKADQAMYTAKRAGKDRVVQVAI